MMPQIVNEVDGVTWESRVKHWLRLRYPLGQFEEIPADHGGDYGIEGFSRDGIAYQCYAAKGQLKVKDLYENQRNKITEDIKKFINRKNEFIKLFGDLKIKSWWLVVPEHRSKKLVEHATAKTVEVINSNLPYVGDNFFIHIADQNEFVVEHQAAVRKGVEALHLGDCTTTIEAVQDWAVKNDSLVEKLDRKIKTYSGEKSPERIRELRERWISAFISAENLLRKIQLSCPGIWEDFLSLKRRKEEKLFLKYSTSCASKDVLDSVLEEIQEDILRKLPNLDSCHAEDLAVGTVSEWLHRCPLNFPDES